MPLRLTGYLSSIVLACMVTFGPFRGAAANGLQNVSASDIQIFAVPSANQLTVGDTLSIRVELFASPDEALAGLMLARAMNGLRFVTEPSFASVTGASLVSSRRAVRVGDTPVHVFARTVSLRVTEPGTWEFPPLSFEFDGRTISTERFGIRVAPAQARAGMFEKSVLPIFAEFQAGSRHIRFRRSGSAFLVRENAVATSYHVILDARAVVMVLPSGRRVRLTRAWAIDPVRDVALLYIDPAVVRKEELSVLPMASYGDIDEQGEQGQFVFSLGWRGNRPHRIPGILHGALSDISWSSTNAVRPGDSGGALLDHLGRVIGVITAGSVSAPGGDELREEVCIASDPRPALRAALTVERARALSDFFDDEAFGRSLYVRGHRLASILLMSRNRRFPQAGERSLTDQVETLSAGVKNSEPFDADLLYLIGFIEQLVGSTADAAESFRTVLQKSENHFQAAYMLALYHLRRREYVEARRYFRLTSEFEPYYHLALYGLARSELGLHHYDAAEDLLRSVLSFDGGFAPAFFDLAGIYMTRDNSLLAKQIYVRLTMLDQNWASRLKIIMDNPILVPSVLDEIPRVPVAPPGFR